MSDCKATKKRKDREHDLLGRPQTSLLERLNSGVGSVTEADRAAYATGNDDQAWKNPRLLEELRRVHSGHVSSAHRSDLPHALQALSDLFAEPNSEYLVRALLHHPEHLLGVVLPELLRPKEIQKKTRKPEDNRERKKASALYTWTVFTVCIELLWKHVSSKEGSAHRHLEPLAARTRFLALSEVFRHDSSESIWKKWWGEDSLYHLFGDSKSPATLVRKAREARDIWRGHLNRHQTLSLFDHASPLAIEKEIQWLAFQEPDPRQGRPKPLLSRVLPPNFSGGPLPLSSPKTEREGENQRLIPPDSTAADRAALVDVVERHLLPRFAVLESWSAIRGLHSHKKEQRFPFTYGPLSWSLLFIATAIALGVVLFIDPIPSALVVAPAGLLYGFIGIKTLKHGRAWAMPLLLRLPAAGAVGLIVLVAFHPDWWENVTWGWGLISALVVLGGVSFGYLLIEARNHNTGMISDEGWTPYVLAVRALSVTITGLAHSLFVAVVGMITLTTVFGEKNHQLREVWAGTSDLSVSPSAILAAATFWCLAAGVFSQILWDDQPITAPLSHRRWRDER